MFKKPSLSLGAGVIIAILLGELVLHREARAVEYPTLTVLRELNGLGGRRLSVRGTLAFVQRTNALAIFDLADFANPVQKGVLNLSTAAEGMHANVAVSDNLLALAAYPGGSARERIYLINISDIEHPALATSWEARPSSMTFAQNFLFVTSSRGDSLRVYDVSNPTAPNLVFSEPDRLLPFENGDPPTERGDAEGVVVRGNYAFVRYGSGRRQVGGGTVLPLLVVYNVSNPAAPTEVTSAAIPTIRTYCYPSLALTGPTLLFSGFFFGGDPADKGVSTMDVGDPFQPRFVADMQVWDVPNLGVGPSVLYAAPVAGFSSALLVFANGLALVDVSSPALPTVQGIFQAPATDAAFCSGRILLLTDSKLYVLQRPAMSIPLSVTGVSPTDIGIGPRVQLTVLGTGMVQGATARLSNGIQTFTASSVTINEDGTELVALFNLSTAQAGVWTLTVENPDHQTGSATVTLHDVPAIVITNVSPDTVQAWGQVTLTAQGTGFLPGMTAALRYGRWPEIRAESVSLGKNGMTATMTFNVTGVYPGPRKLVMSHAGGVSGEFLNAVDIQSFLRINAVTPSFGLPGDATLEVAGRGFLAGDTVRLSKSGGLFIIEGTGVSAASDGTRLTVRFHTSDADTGLWNLEVRHPSGDAKTLRDAYAVATVGDIIVSPSVVSGLASEFTVRIRGDLVQYGPQPILRYEGGAVQPTRVEQVQDTEMAATFPMSADVPLGLAHIILVQNDTDVSLPANLFIVGSVRSAGTMDRTMAWVSGEGFVEGCTAWIEEMGTGARVDARTVTVPTDIQMTIDFGESPEGCWKLYIRGPGGRVITRVPQGGQGPDQYLVFGAGITRVSAAAGGPGQVTLRIEGQGLGEVESVSLVRGKTAIQGAVLPGGSEERFQVRFNLAGAELGAYDLIVQSKPGKSSGSGRTFQLRSGFTVVAANPHMQLRVEVPSMTRVGRTVNGTIVVSNYGNLDAFGAVVLKGITGEATWSFGQATAIPDMTQSFPTLQGGLGELQIGELTVPIGQTLDIHYSVRMDHEGEVSVQPTWVGLHQLGQSQRGVTRK